MRTIFSLHILMIIILALHNPAMLSMSETENKVDERTTTLVKNILREENDLNSFIVDKIKIKYGPTFGIDLHELVMTIPSNTSNLRTTHSSDPEKFTLKGNIINIRGQLYHKWFKEDSLARSNIPVISNARLQFLADKYEIKHTKDKNQLYYRGIELSYVYNIPSHRSWPFFAAAHDKEKQD